MALGLAACSKQTVGGGGPEEGFVLRHDGVRCPLTVTIGGAATKVINVIDNDPGTEAAVNSLQVFVFDGEKLDDYVVSNYRYAQANCSPGERVVYAVVNAPDLNPEKGGPHTKEDLLATRTLLAENAPDSFVMMGVSEVVILPNVSEISIEVKRIASRIVLKKITADFAATYLRDQDFIVEEIYATNVAGENNLGGTMNEYSVWHNRLGYYADKAYEVEAVTKLTHDFTTGSGTNLVNSGSYTNKHCFYVYPNSYTVDERGMVPEGAPWSPRCTKLVVKMNFRGRSYYYPVTLGTYKDVAKKEIIPITIESNKSYEINELILTRTGSNDEDISVTNYDIVFVVEPKDWDVVLLGDNGVITL